MCSKRTVAGTVFADGNPRIIQIKGIDMEAKLGPHMLYTVNHDKPGYIGALGDILGNADLNIATFHLGRNKDKGEAIALIKLDNASTLMTSSSKFRISIRSNMRPN